MCSYLIQTIILSKREAGKTSPVWRVGSSGRRENVHNGKVNIVQLLCIHVCKWKNDAFKTIPRIEVGGIKENDGGGEFKYDIFEIL
jgi:hypothetical protein